MYTDNSYKHEYTYAHTQKPPHRHTCTNTHAYIHTWMHTYIPGTCTTGGLGVPVLCAPCKRLLGAPKIEGQGPCMYACMHACMYVRTYVCIYVCALEDIVMRGHSLGVWSLILYGCIDSGWLCVCLTSPVQGESISVTPSHTFMDACKRVYKHTHHEKDWNIDANIHIYIHIYAHACACAYIHEHTHRGKSHIDSWDANVFTYTRSKDRHIHANTHTHT
jgi:hypothetical protein